MKKYFYFLPILLLSFIFNHKAQTIKAENPFFNEWKTPFQTPPFSEIKHEHFLPAYEEGIKQQNIEFETIDNNQEKPTFENTVVAIEKSGQLLTKVNKVFSSLNGTDTDDEMQ
ncbi:MAG: peptidase M3, partial [Ignavibacteriaceae bacterium]|nr:peptidase M3 [Ignavibacteriaceae bacterium]